MSTSKTTTDRQKLIELLRRLWSNDNADTEQEILDIVYRHLYEELRPMLLAKFGRQVGEASASTRFTELLNRFFAKVMEAFPENMEQLQTRRALSDYVSVSMQHLVYDHSKKGAREQTCDDTLLDCLIEESRQKFQQDCPQVQYESAIKVVRRWQQSCDPLWRQWAKLIRYRYILGETQARTQRDLEVSTGKYYELEQQALEQLRREVQQ